MWALIFVIITSGMIISHSVFLASNRREIDVRYRQQALASTFARSGLRDALGWFRKQSDQPVSSFAPELDPTAEPPLLDTLDPTLGLVREFEIRGGLWGRYEVRKEDAVDVSAERGSSSPGSVWEVGSRSYIYQLVDPGKPFDQKPNRIVSTTSLHTEMRGVPLIPPAAGAVLIDDPRRLELGRNARVDGGTSPGVVHASGGGLLGGLLDFVADVLAVVTGTPVKLDLLNYRADPEHVFGMGLDSLRAISDYVLRLNVPPPRRLPDNKVLFVDGDLVLPAATAAGARPFQGKMLLVVNGDLIAHSGNRSDIRGMVFVTGDAVIQGPFKLSGSIVVRGQMQIGTAGGGADQVSIVYDGAAIQDLKSEIARYRLSNDVRLANQTSGSEAGGASRFLRTK